MDGHTQRFVTVSVWVEINDEWWSVLGPVFSGDMDSGIQCTLNKPVDDTRLTSLGTPEGRNANQTYLDRLEGWAHVNLQQGKVRAVPNMETAWLKIRLRAVLPRRTWG